MSQTINKCCRCAKMLDQSAFDDGFKTCRECIIKRRVYRGNNIEHVREISKAWESNYKEVRTKHYHDNKDQLNAYKAEKINCDCCGSLVGRGSMAKHKKTDKCKNHNLETKTEINK